MTTKTCPVSGKEFQISDRNIEYYEKLGVPLPTLCPAERARRRMAYRNERNLYKSKCAFSGEQLLSMYHPDDGYTIYEKDIWISDKWEGAAFGRNFDFGRGFFEQFRELQKAVPRANLAIFVNNENSEYCNYVGDVKNSYLCFGSIFIEDCMYGNPYYSKNCVDCFLIRKSELCYECIDCEGLYNCLYLQDSVECRDCSFSFDLKGCNNCVGCAGLRNKQYQIFNKQYSREDFEKFVGEFSFCDKEKAAFVERKLAELKMQHPHRGVVSLNCENVSGNFLFNSKNCFDCFQVMENEDCSYNIQTTTSKDCYDMNYTEENELCYEYLGNYRNYKALFCLLPYGCNDILYSEYLTNCKNCFGCVGLKNKQFCILNKQYSESEYHEMVARIVALMKERGEWGEFFPVRNSPFGYNETVAFDYFPLSKEDAMARGYRWREAVAADFKPATISYVSDRIEDVPDSILDEVLACEVTGRNYKITPAELKFYKRMKLPIPRKHFFERLKARLAKRLPYELFDHACDKCGAAMRTPYAGERREKVYCEQCYLKEIY